MSAEIPGMAQEGDADLQEYAEGLGVDLFQDGDLRWVVQEAFEAALPAGWTEHTDDEGRLYFFKEETGESAWEHPTDAVYRELIAIVTEARHTQVARDETACARLIHAHLREVHQRALDALEGWSGPYQSTEGEYYYNEHLKVSAWQSPLVEWNHELVLRHSLLCRCLLPGDLTVVGADGSIEHLPETGGPQASGAQLLQMLQLPLELLRKGDSSNNSDAPRSPATSRDYFTARSGCSTTRSQHSSTRSGGERHRDRAGVPAKRDPKRAPKPLETQAETKEEVLTIFTRPDPEVVG